MESDRAVLRKRGAVFKWFLFGFRAFAIFDFRGDGALDVAAGRRINELGVGVFRRRADRVPVLLARDRFDQRDDSCPNSPPVETRGNRRWRVGIPVDSRGSARTRLCMDPRTDALAGVGPGLFRLLRSHVPEPQPRSS